MLILLQLVQMLQLILKRPFLIYFPFVNKICSFELTLNIGINASKILIDDCSKFFIIIISLFDVFSSIANKNLVFSSINSMFF